MALKPDYGLRLKKDGRGSSVNLYFHGFAVYNLAVLSRDRYSTCVDIPYAGQLHAMSLDFGPDHLEAILSRGSPRLRMFVKSQLVQDPATPRDIDLPEVVKGGGKLDRWGGAKLDRSWAEGQFLSAFSWGGWNGAWGRP